MSPHSRFFKSIAWTLIFSFSFSQSGFALTPRELLEQAKSAFSLIDEDRRAGSGYTSTRLTQSQTLAQSTVDQQNTLSDLQDMNFTLTTQSGDLLTYVNNTLSKIVIPGWQLGSHACCGTLKTRRGDSMGLKALSGYDKTRGKNFSSRYRSLRT